VLKMEKANEISELEFKLANVFTNLTGITPLMVIANKNGIGFLIQKKDMSKAIGKNGKNIHIMAKKTNKQIYVFADSPSLEGFVRNLLSDVKIIALDINDIMGEKAVTVLISEKDRAKVLGKNKARISLIEAILKKKFNAILYLKMKVI